MESITRCATITSINGNIATVSFVRSEACGSCAAKSACGLTATSPVSVQVVLDKPDLYQVGQNVSLQISVTNAFSAAFFAYILPLILMLLCLSVSIMLKLTETTAAALSLLILPLYYGCLYFFFHKIKPQIKINLL